MACPDCASTATTRRKGRTALGYRRFRCQACRRRFNGRTGTPFNDLQYPTDIVLLAVLWRLRYKLGFRDVAELLLERGFEVTHETIRAWEVPWGGKTSCGPPILMMQISWHRLAVDSLARHPLHRLASLRRVERQ